MALETEIRFELKDYKQLKSRLRKIGAKFLERERIVDENFTLKTRNFWKTVECLRIRSDGKSKEALLTYKPSGKRYSKFLSVNEINVKVSDKEALKKIFSYLGIVPLPHASKVEKVRETYKLGNFLIVIDHVKGIGKFVEIECTRKRNVKKKLLEIAKKLGFREQELMKESVGFRFLKV
jgi:predicted adenylyl cyclase CyaB